MWLEKLFNFKPGTDFYLIIGGLVCLVVIFIIIPGLKMIWEEKKDKQNRGEV